MTLTINQAPQTEQSMGLMLTTDKYDEWATRLAYAGPIGFGIGLTFIALRRIPMLIDFPVGVWNFFINGDVPEWVPPLEDVLPQAKKHVVARQVKQEAEKKVKEIKQAEQQAERQYFQSQRKMQQTAAKEVPVSNVLDDVVKMFMDDKDPDNCHILIAGKSGAGKNVIQRYIMNKCIEIAPDTKIFHIDPKWKTVEFEYDREPHFKGIDEAKIGINEARQIMEARRADPHFDSRTAPKIIVVIDELFYIYEAFPEVIKDIVTLINVMRGLGMGLITNTQSYNASDHGMSEPTFDSFIKIVSGGLVEKFIAKKLTHLDNNITRTLAMQFTSYTQQKKRSVLIVPAKGAASVKLMPHLFKAFEEMKKPLPPMQINGANGVSYETKSNAKSSNNGHDLDFPCPELWQTEEGDAWMLVNHQYSIERNGTQWLGQQKAAAKFGVGVDPTYRNYLNSLLAKQAMKPKQMPFDLEDPQNSRSETEFEGFLS